VTNVLHAIGSLDGPPEPVAPTREVESFDWLRSPVEGIFHCAVRVDQRVSKGDVVGELVDLVGEPLATVLAPASGVVLFVVTSPAIKKDGLLLAIGALGRP
jgi:hypothetical protein